MKMKKLMGSLIATVMAMGMIGGTNVKAKVIEPEVVRIETWTTSYFIDDDVNTLYPYIQCEADIYNDGTIRVYAWNTYEWNGFATVGHTASFIETDPLSYSKYQKIKNKIKDYKCNFYPEDYKYSTYGFCQTFERTSEIYREYPDYVYSRMFEGALPKMNFYSERPDYSRMGNLDYGAMTFTPKTEPTKTYDFKIYGHDITITPDLLQSTSMPEPPVNETASLKAENESLKAELSALKTSYDQLSATLANQKNRAYGDMNDDGYVDARDASLLLTLYARQSVGDPITIDQLIEEQKGQ